MNQFGPAEKLHECRPLLLAMEAIGWLHMVGKAKTAFLCGHGGVSEDNKYEYDQWFKYENPPFPWDDLLKWVRDRFILDQEAWPSALTDFVSRHAKSDSGLLGLLQAGHGMASGIEKNLPKPTSGYLGQGLTQIWLSSAFGRPVRNLLAEPPEVLTDAGWKRLVEEIRRVLEELKSLGQSGCKDVQQWWYWREKAIGAESFLRQALMSTLAETRLPNNDVTLWDQSYVAAALFKSAVAGAILEELDGHAFPWGSNDLKRTTQWRLLTIGMGTRHYEARAVKIGDWTGAQQAIGDFFARVRKLVEVDLALGSLLYRDTEVAVFSFPGERDGANTDLKIDQWKEYLQARIDKLAQDLKLETPPYCNVSRGASRSLILLTKEVRRARETMVVPVSGRWNIPDTNGSARNGHVCPVCLVRLNGRPNDKHRPCEVCDARRRHRLDGWLQGRMGNNTIWIDEVADGNDRVALLTLSLDIEPWLEGSRADSLRAQSIAEWRRYNPVLTEYWQREEQRRKGIDNPIDTSCAYEKAVRCLESTLQNARAHQYRVDPNDIVLANLQEGYRREPNWPTFFQKIVEDRADDAPEWKDLNDDERAHWLAHQLFRKLASPGRVYRFWRQTEAFFDNLLKDFRQVAAQHPNCWRVRRLVLKPDQVTSGWQDRETYSGRWRDVPLELLYRKESQDFLTVCNLARLLRAEEPKDALKGLDIRLRDDEGGQFQLKVKDVEDDAGLLGVYHPVIPLELSPLRFRVLVPLEAATECVRRAIEAWEEEFSRVWDRLPLHVGVVAFPRKTPFQAVIEAVRNLEHDLQKDEKDGRPELWRVAESRNAGDVVALRLVRRDGTHECRLVPVRLPGGREDVFYPYFAVEDTTIRFPRDFQHPKGQVYRHVADLRLGDGVQIHPSRIATLFLESTAHRFDHVEIRYLGDWQAMRATWDLVKRLAPSQTALTGAWGELETRRQSWRKLDGAWLEGAEGTWLELVRAVLSNRLGAKGAALETLVEAAQTGVLAWSLEWHLRVLKKRIGGGTL